MDRLDFTLPEFTRISWVSDVAREVWEPRLQRITKSWLEIEWLSVVAGLRCCGITLASPEVFVNRSGQWIRNGLSAWPLETQGLSNYFIDTNNGAQVSAGVPFVFRILLGSPESVAQFQSALDHDDDSALAHLLGIPPCCYEFLQRISTEGGFVDTTWPMAVASRPEAECTRHIEVSGFPESNVLWRWMGVRAVPHLPCCFDCAPTAELGRKLIALGRSAGYEDEMEWLSEIISWPVSWSALHGIAEIKTPLVKVSTRTDATSCKYVVLRRGERYPIEGGQSLRFPYRMGRALHSNASRSSDEGLHNFVGSSKGHLRPEMKSTNDLANSVATLKQTEIPPVTIEESVLNNWVGLPSKVCHNVKCVELAVNSPTPVKKMAGSCRLTMSKSNPELGTLSQVAVAPEFRRRGIATALCARALDIFRRQNGEALFLSLGRDPTHAMGLYRRLGWQKLAEANIMVFLANGQTPEAFLLDYFAEQGPVTIQHGVASDAISMLPLIYCPHSWQVLDTNTGIFSTRYVVQTSCMGLMGRYLAIDRDAQGAWFVARTTTHGGRIVGMCTVRLSQPQSTIAHLDGFTHLRALNCFSDLIQVAANWAHERAVCLCDVSVSVEDDVKRSVFESLGFHNVEKNGDFDLGGRNVRSLRLQKTFC